MEETSQKRVKWTVCPQCKGNGKIRQKRRKRPVADTPTSRASVDTSKFLHPLDVLKNGPHKTCKICGGSGLVQNSEILNKSHVKFPKVAIVGGGIAGVALAVACKHRGIPFQLYERDTSFDARAQGYGLTLQQAGKALSGFGISELKDAVISTSHTVHDTAGTILASWGMRKWLSNSDENVQKHSNMHIPRQRLRMALLEQLEDSDLVKWGHQLIDFKKNEAQKIELRFEADGHMVKETANILIGADGIRSAVRQYLFGTMDLPLHYLDCMVILGICSLDAVENTVSPLLDGASVFQTSNGSDRIYIMPYDKSAVMWQLSFKISEAEAKALSESGKTFLKKEALLKTAWHDPIPQMIKATLEMDISGYPVYDRAVPDAGIFNNAGKVTLIGDAAHPMSPFKGQGANQALLDALELGRRLYMGYAACSKDQSIEIRKDILAPFEREMIERSASKVRDSAAAAVFLHTDVVLTQADAPRGSCAKLKTKNGTTS